MRSGTELTCRCTVQDQIPLEVNEMGWAIRHLCQLGRGDFYSAIAEGIILVIESAVQLANAAESLVVAEHHRGAQILNSLCLEECSKVLILLDAVRCPNAERSPTLANFYNHIAKGIYVEAFDWRSGTFQEHEGYVNQARDSHYLDGPNGVEWIFPNKITQAREDNMYVNYVRDDGSDESPYWTQPTNQEPTFGYSSSDLLLFVSSLSAAGLDSPEGIECVAEVWRNVDPRQPNMSVTELWTLNSETLSRVASRKKIEVDKRLVRLWPYPLWPLKLHKDVEVDDLLVVQENWSPYDPY